MSDYNHAKLSRRIQHLVRTAYQTNDTNETGVVQTVQVQHNEFEGVRDGVPSVQMYGFASASLPGCNHVILNVQGDNSNGVSIATNDQTYRPTGLLPGECTIYDNAGQSVHIKQGVIVAIIANQQIEMTAPTITLNASTAVVVNSPILKCSGDILDQYNTQSETMAEQRAVYNEHTHQIVSVQSGGDTVTSQVPNQLET